MKSGNSKNSNVNSEDTGTRVHSECVGKLLLTFLCCLKMPFARLENQTKYSTNHCMFAYCSLG